MGFVLIKWVQMDGSQGNWVLFLNIIDLVNMFYQISCKIVSWLGIFVKLLTVTWLMLYG